MEKPTTEIVPQKNIRIPDQRNKKYMQFLDYFDKGCRAEDNEAVFNAVKDSVINEDNVSSATDFLRIVHAMYINTMHSGKAECKLSRVIFFEDDEKKVREKIDKLEENGLVIYNRETNTFLLTERSVKFLLEIMNKVDYWQGAARRPEFTLEQFDFMDSGIPEKPRSFIAEGRRSIEEKIEGKTR